MFFVISFINFNRVQKIYTHCYLLNYKQDFTGVPAVVDFAAMRDAVKRLGGDPDKINPVCPSDLVIDHSIQVDFTRRYGSLFSKHVIFDNWKLKVII